MQQFFSLLSWSLFTAQHVSGVFPHIIRSSMTAIAGSGFTFVSWWQSCCVRGRAGRGGKTPETCWAINKLQDNKVKNCCTRFVIYLNCTIMHGLTNLKFYFFFFCIRPRRKEVTVPLPWRTPEVADTVFSTPDGGCMTPETCRVTWQRINVYILSHRVGPY